MEKINVFHIITELGDGGVETMLMDIYRNIDKNKFKFFFVVQNEKRRYSEEIESLGGEIIQIKSLKEIGLFKYIRQLKDLFIKYGADVVHCHNLTQNSVILYAAYIAKIKIRVSHSHLTTCFSKKSKLLMPLIRCVIIKYSTHRIACGKEAGYFLYGKKDFTVIHNAIDIDRFMNASIDKVGKLPKNINNYFVILHVGRLSEQKNHKFIIEIAKRLDTDTCFLCCGDGPLYNHINELIKINHLEKKVYLLKSRDDIPELMSYSNLAILPSLYEGLPVTLIEAQASGLKTIVSNKVDKDCDLNLGLVDFLPIDSQSVDEWVSKINYYKIKGYTCNKNIKETIRKAGYDSMVNCKILSKIYSLSKK